MKRKRRRRRGKEGRTKDLLIIGALRFTATWVPETKYHQK